MSGKTERDEFAAGYLIAVANIVHLHDEPTIAMDVLRELGVGPSVLKGLDLSDYDTKPLKALFNEEARLKANAERRALARSEPPQATVDEGGGR